MPSAELSDVGSSGLTSMNNIGAQAATMPPQASTIGRMEWVHHWDRLPTDKRLMLLMLARDMNL